MGPHRKHCRDGRGCPEGYERDANGTPSFGRDSVGHEEPGAEWEYTALEDWPPVLQQDFNNMAAVQQGMKSAGFRGTQPNPYMERTVPSLHYNLARFMGTGAPRKIEKTDDSEGIGHNSGGTVAA